MTAAVPSSDRRSLPADYPVTTDLITGLRLQGDTPIAGSVTTSNERINRIHRMAQYSFGCNTMTIFTDCPGREKQSYPADYTMVMGSIHRNEELASYLRGHMRHFAEGQSMADTFMRGNEGSTRRPEQASSESTETTPYTASVLARTGSSLWTSPGPI